MAKSLAKPRLNPKCTEPSKAAENSDTILVSTTEEYIVLVEHICCTWSNFLWGKKTKIFITHILCSQHFGLTHKPSANSLFQKKWELEEEVVQTPCFSVIIHNVKHLTNFLWFLSLYHVCHSLACKFHHNLAVEIICSQAQSKKMHTKLRWDTAGKELKTKKNRTHTINYNLKYKSLYSRKNIWSLWLSVRPITSRHKISNIDFNFQA